MIFHAGRPQFVVWISAHIYPTIRRTNHRMWALFSAGCRGGKKRGLHAMGKGIETNKHAVAFGRCLVGLKQPTGAMQEDLSFAGAWRPDDQMMTVGSQFDNCPLFGGQLAGIIRARMTPIILHYGCILPGARSHRLALVLTATTFAGFPRQLPSSVRPRRAAASSNQP